MAWVKTLSAARSHACNARAIFDALARYSAAIAAAILQAKFAPCPVICGQLYQER
jgi:hypothetical protein